MRNSETGNTLFLNLLILMTVTYLGLKLISNKLSTIRRARYLNQQYLCMKEFNGSSRELIKRVELINQVILVKKTIDYLLYLYPPLKAAVALASDFGEKGLEAVQVYLLLSYLKKYADYLKQGCHFDPRYLKSPYRISGLGFKRDPVSRRTILRSQRWQQILFMPKEKAWLKSRLQVNGSDLSTKTSFHGFAW